MLICRYQHVMRIKLLNDAKKSLPCFVHPRPKLWAECFCKVRNFRMCRAVDRSHQVLLGLTKRFHINKSDRLYTFLCAVIALISCFRIFVKSLI